MGLGTARLCNPGALYIVPPTGSPLPSHPRESAGPSAAPAILFEAKAIMSSVPLILRPSQDASDGWIEFHFSRAVDGRTDVRLRRALADLREVASPNFRRQSFVTSARAHIAATARHVLAESESFPLSRHTPIVATRTHAALCEPASFVRKFSLAEKCATGGIKHGTVRKGSTPRERTESILPITHSTGRQGSSSWITPSWLAHLSSMSKWPTAQPSRSDRFSDGCRTSEDQGGPQ